MSIFRKIFTEKAIAGCSMIGCSLLTAVSSYTTNINLDVISKDNSKFTNLVFSTAASAGFGATIIWGWGTVENGRLFMKLLKHV